MPASNEVDARTVVGVDVARDRVRAERLASFLIEVKAHRTLEVGAVDRPVAPAEKWASALFVREFRRIG